VLVLALAVLGASAINMRHLSRDSVEAPPQESASSTPTSPPAAPVDDAAKLAHKAYRAAKQAVKDASANQQNALAALAAAKAAKATAASAVPPSQETVFKAKAAVIAATEDLLNARKRLHEYKINSVQPAQQKVDRDNRDKAAKEALRAQTVKSLESAKTLPSEIQHDAITGLNGIKTRLEPFFAQAKVNADELTKVNTEYAKLKAARDDKKAKREAAAKDYQAALSAARKAQNTLTEKLVAYNDAAAKVQAATIAMSDAQSNRVIAYRKYIDALQARLDFHSSSLGVAKEELAKIEKATNTAAGLVNIAQTRYDDLKKKVDETKEKLQKAQSNLSVAKTAAEEAQKAVSASRKEAELASKALKDAESAKSKFEVENPATL